MAGFAAHIRKARIWALAAAALMATMSPAFAEGTVALSWDRPANATDPPVLEKSYTGPGSYDLYVTLTGQTTQVRAFFFKLQIGVGRPRCPSSTAVPPAWRFDGGGCQSGRACFVGGGLWDPEPNLDLLSGLSYDSQSEQGVVIVAEGSTVPLVNRDPSRTYTLARLHFEHSGLCAGESDSIYICLIQAHWITEWGGGEEYAWGGENEACLFWNSPPAVKGTCSPLVLAAADPLVSGFATSSIDPYLGLCDLAVPARNATWGRVKAAYR